VRCTAAGVSDMNMPKPTTWTGQLEKLVGAWHGQERLTLAMGPARRAAVGRHPEPRGARWLRVIQEYEQERRGA